VAATSLMTIHAGEKAARLRRSTTNSSYVIPNTSSLTYVTTQTDSNPAHSSEQSLHREPLAFRSLSNPVRPRRSTSTSTKQKYTPSQYVSPGPPSPTDSLVNKRYPDHFVFTGIDPPPAIESGGTTTPLDWEAFDIGYPSLTDKNEIVPRSLIFFQPSPKESGNAKTLGEAADGSTTQSHPSNTSVSSPRPCTSWFFTISNPTAPPPQVESLDESTSTLADVNGTEEGPNDKVERKTKPKKKNKSKRRGNAKRALNKDAAQRGDDLASDTVTVTTPTSVLVHNNSDEAATERFPKAPSDAMELRGGKWQDHFRRWRGKVD
jgi:hypothetical protein